MNRNYEEILKKCRNILKTDPNNAEALATLRLIYKIRFDDNLILFEDHFQTKEHLLYLQNHLFLFHLIEEISKKEKIRDDIKIKSYSLSPKNLLNLVHDFFKNATTKEFYKMFINMLKNNEIVLYKNKDYKFGAYTVYWAFINTPIMIVICNNYYEDMEDDYIEDDYIYVPIIAHEIGHGISDLINYHIAFQQENSIFDEIISTFFELICNDYFYHTSYKNSAINYAYRNYNDIINRAQILCDYNSSSLEDPALQYCYVVGFNIAIELYIIYLSDKDKAFYLLNEIIKVPKFLPSEEYFERILKLGITPNNNLNEYENILKRML